MLNSKSLFSVYFLLICTFLILSGCYKKEFGKLTLANAQPEYLYPLLDAQLNLGDIVDPNKKKLFITTDTTGFYTFTYYNNLFQQYITDLLKIADININQSVSLTAPEVASLPVSGSVTQNFANSFTLATTNGEQLKTITLKSGNIPFNISSTFKQNIQITITFPYITKNSIPLSKIITMNYGGSVPLASNNTIDLTGYTIDLSQNNTTVNTISYTATLKVNYIAGNPISTTQKISISTGLSGLQYSYAAGYIGQYTITIPKDTVSINLFDNAYAGNIFFTNPVVEAIITNSVGAPSEVKINTLTALSNINGTTPITGTEINTNIPIAYPPTQQSAAMQTIIALDNTNSNVQTVFNPAPNKIIYQMTGTVNPAGNTGSLNFVTDSSKIAVEGQVEIPMEGKVTKFVLLDTITGMTYPSLTISGSQVSIQKAGFNINLQNGFPLDAIIQMYFLDKNNKVIDSLFDTGSQLIASGQIDVNGKVISPTNTLIKDLFTQQRYTNITTNSTTAVLFAFFRTANNGTVPVKIYSSYQIKANIGIDLQANVSF